MKNISNMNTMYITPETRKAIETIEKISSLNSEKIYEILPSLMIVSDYGCGTTSLGKMYGNIVEKTFKVKGKKNFLELVFPKDNPKDESLFYASPQRVAYARNRYYGTVLVSFEEFKGDDLLKNESFKNLLEYIEGNKENIRFIFRILPSFTMKKQLIAKLSEYLNIIEVVMEKPQNEMAYEYVMQELKELNYRVENENVEMLKNTLSQVVGQDNYCGYRTLNNVIKKINYEMILENSNDRIVTGEIIEKLGRKLIEEFSFNQTEKRIGFYV